MLSEEDVLVEFIRLDTFNFVSAPSRGESVWKPAHYIAFIMLGKEPDNVQMLDLGEVEPIDKKLTELLSR